MSDKLKLEVIFAARDKFLGPVGKIIDGSRAATKELNAAKKALKDLNAQQKLIDSYRSTNKALGINANDLTKARELVKKLNLEMAATAVPTAKMQRALDEATKKARELAGTETNLIAKKQRLRQELAAAGFDTKQLASQQRDLKVKLDAATAAVEKQNKALEAAKKKMQVMKAAEAELNKARTKWGKVAAIGAGATAAGAALSLPLGKAAKDFADFETAMLGVARQVDGARDENGKLTATYYEVGDAVKAMSERLPMAANDIAAIVAAGARMGIQGKENLLIYAETTAIMANAFELPAEQIGEDIGKISNLYNVAIKDIEALGDTLNWLDDNAESTGADIIDVMTRIAGTATTVGMSYKEAAALGSTFLSLGASAEVAASASNAMIRELSVATMQSKRFREGAAMLNLDLKELQKSASTDTTGTIIKIMEAINRLPEEKRLEAATRLFGKEFGDDAAKLATKLGDYRKQLALVNDEKARGSMRREAEARDETLDAQMTMTKNALTNLSSDLGEHLRPALIETLKNTRAIIQAVRAWAAENKGLVSAIMTVVKWIAGSLTVLGGLAMALAAVAVPFAMFRFWLTNVAVVFPVLSARAAGFSVAIRGTFAIIRAHPFYAVAAAAAYAVGFLITKWDDLKKLFRSGNWFGIGKLLIEGLIGGMDAMSFGLFSKITGLIGMGIKAAKDALGIRSPSRVFAAIGHNTMAGLENGLDDGEGGPVRKMRDIARRMVELGDPKATGDMAKKLAALGAGIAIGGSAAAGNLTLDTRPPIGAAAAAGNLTLDTRPPIGAAAAAGALAPMNVTIHIHGAPGQPVNDIQQQVERALASIEARRAAQQRSRLRDSE